MLDFLRYLENLQELIKHELFVCLGIYTETKNIVVIGSLVSFEQDHELKHFYSILMSVS